MAGRSVSGYVDEKVAKRLSDIAQAEARSPANIVGQALGFTCPFPRRREIRCAVSKQWLRRTSCGGSKANSFDCCSKLTWG